MQRMSSRCCRVCAALARDAKSRVRWQQLPTAAACDSPWGLLARSARPALLLQVCTPPISMPPAGAQRVMQARGGGASARRRGQGPRPQPAPTTLAGAAGPAPPPQLNLGDPRITNFNILTGTLAPQLGRLTELRVLNLVGGEKRLGRASGLGVRWPSSWPPRGPAAVAPTAHCPGPHTPPGPAPSLACTRPTPPPLPARCRRCATPRCPRRSPHPSPQVEHNLYGPIPHSLGNLTSLEQFMLQASLPAVVLVDGGGGGIGNHVLLMIVAFGRGRGLQAENYDPSSSGIAPPPPPQKYTRRTTS